MELDDVIEILEVAAEAAIRSILMTLEEQTGRRVEWVKVETRNGIHVTVNTSK